MIPDRDRKWSPIWTANDPRPRLQVIPKWTANNPRPRPQMISKRCRKWPLKWLQMRPQVIPKMDSKWSPTKTANDPQNGQQMIVTVDRKWSREENQNGLDRSYCITVSRYIIIIQNVRLTFKGQSVQQRRTIRQLKRLLGTASRQNL